MPPLPASNSNTANADPNPLSEAILPSSTLVLPVPLLLILSALHVLYIVGPSILRWRFPCQTTADLDRLLADLRKLIEKNSCLEQRLIIPQQAGVFESALENLRNQVSEIRIRPEPPRTNPFVWIMFWWRVLKDIDRRYADFRKLELEVQATIHAAQKAESDADM
ncbi:hypothetical protein Moror_2592 [Moniliophthora roreri MCA 2997]|uniref:Uncharacterized protein n=1 Tax=Moniliophthora roreri (strain MCA 2997) TaxID=1381753 RepID=V2WXE0_MONRO|nr:hypothetical protein Moror_2592 [Moniliophthora roreri MCA 2997]KAI3619331.1 hypothetical protein WG66_012993 [Moniliophthora roreri]